MSEKMLVAFGQGRAVVLDFAGDILEAKEANIGLADTADYLGVRDHCGGVALRLRTLLASKEGTPTLLTEETADAR
jgi:hypothetical protein